MPAKLAPQPGSPIKVSRALPWTSRLAAASLVLNSGPPPTGPLGDHAGRSEASQIGVEYQRAHEVRSHQIFDIDGVCRVYGQYVRASTDVADVQLSDTLARGLAGGENFPLFAAAAGGLEIKACAHSGNRSLNHLSELCRREHRHRKRAARGSAQKCGA